MIHWYILLVISYLFTFVLIIKVRKYYRECEEWEKMFNEMIEGLKLIEKYSEINGFKVSELPNNPHKMKEEEGETE